MCRTWLGFAYCAEDNVLVSGVFGELKGTVLDEITEAGLIHKYFSEGHTYEVILDFLGTKHNIFLSLSTLKRRLRNAGLTRRTDYTPIGTVNAAITHELTGSGQLLGYRALWQTLRQKYFLTVKRDDVMLSIRRLDPLEFNFLYIGMQFK